MFCSGCSLSAYTLLNAGLLTALGLHLSAVLLVLGLSLIALSENFKQDPDSRDMLLNISRCLTGLCAAAVLCGLAVMLLQWSIRRSVAELAAPGWLAVALLSALGYGACHVYRQRFNELSDRQRLACSALSTACFLLVALWFVQRGSRIPDLSANASFNTGPLSPSLDPLVWLRFTHLLSSALMLGGLAIALFNERRQRQEPGDYYGRISLGLNWYIWSGLISIGVGLALMVLTPAPNGQLFVGGNPGATLILFIGTGAALTGMIAAIRLHVVNCAVASYLCLLAMLMLRVVLDQAVAGELPPAELFWPPLAFSAILLSVIFISALARFLEPRPD